MPRPIRYKIVKMEGGETLTTSIDRNVYQTSGRDPHYQQIISMLKAGDKSVVDLFEPIRKVSTALARLSDRLVVRDHNVFWDGDKVDNSLAKQIVRFIEEGNDCMPLVHFYDKISQNPDLHSRSQLYGWLDTHQFTITAEGDILGYKGYRKEPNGVLKSTSSGTASVNDKEFVRQHIPCKVGDVVTMPRASVDSNPNSACSVGLHVGTPNYAKGFGNTRMAILINPRDVVSVPNHDSFQKMRVCRYYVLGPAEEEVSQAVVKNAPQWEPTKPVPEKVQQQQDLPPDVVPEQPKSRVLADEKEEKKVTKPRAKRPTTPARKGSKVAEPKTAATKPASPGPRGKEKVAPAPKAPAPKVASGKIEWTPANLKKLIAADTDAKLQKAFPGRVLSTLKRRRAQALKDQKAGF